MKPQVPGVSYVSERDAGTWSEASMDEALQWLPPGARQASRHSSIYDGLDFPKSSSGR